LNQDAKALNERRRNPIQDANNQNQPLKVLIQVLKTLNQALKKAIQRVQKHGFSCQKAPGQRQIQL